MQKISKFNIKEVEINSIIFDKISQNNGIIIKRNPLTIELDNGTIFKRKLNDSEFYIYDEKDIKEIKARAKKFMDFFGIKPKQ